jgi:multicomponent Na+:H+ antiporter subunit C
MGRLVTDHPPILDGSTHDLAAYADPVPQALILTAIVIGFGVLAFALVLAHRVHYSTASDDIDTIRADRA